MDGRMDGWTDGWMDGWRQRTCKRNIEARSLNDFYHGKAISITYSQGVSVALVIQHA